MYERISTLPRFYKNLIFIAIDACLLPFCLWASLSLRLGDLNPGMQEKYIVFLLLPVLSIPVFVGLGLYKIVVRFMGELNTKPRREESRVYS